MTTERSAGRWSECACPPGNHRFRPVGFGFLECTVCRRLVPRAGLRCDVCGRPAMHLLTRPAGRTRPRETSEALCGRCLDDVALFGLGRGRGRGSGY